MIQLELTAEEYEILKEELNNRLVGLEREILHTAISSFKALLRQRYDTLARLNEKLRALGAAATP